MSEPASISTGIAARYATAILELALGQKTLPAIESDLDALDAALGGIAEFRGLIHSPVYNRRDQADAIAAIAARMGLSEIMVNALGLMASKRRLFVLPQLIASLRARIAEEKGEVTAEVVAATALTGAQSERLAAALKAGVGMNVRVDTSVDGSLIGGLVVKVGSKMIDTSIRSKLANLQNAMKEVG